MKRNALLSTILVLLCLMLMLSGCQKKLPIGELSTRNVREDVGLSLIPIPDTLTRNGVAFTVSNEDSISYSLCGHQYLEKYLEDGWHSTDARIAYLLMQENQSTGEPASASIDWSDTYGQLALGRYRLLQEILLLDAPQGEEYCWISYEFTIE